MQAQIHRTPPPAQQPSTPQVQQTGVAAVVSQGQHPSVSSQQGQPAHHGHPPQTYHAPHAVNKVKVILQFQTWIVNVVVNYGWLDLRS